MSRSGSAEPIVQDSMQIIPMEENISAGNRRDSHRPYKHFGAEATNGEQEHAREENATCSYGRRSTLQELDAISFNMR